MLRNWVRRTVIVLAAVLLIVVASAGYLLYASLPTLDGELKLKGLSASVQIGRDRYGIPSIKAQTREDAFRALGYVTVGDRLFQMDLLRRRSAGTLAEILGPGLLDMDRWHRTLGFKQVAGKILAGLPDSQQAVLRAHAEGVNAAIAASKVLPFEFLVLGYQPAPWTPEDSLLEVLGLYETLDWSGYEEQMATVMEASLPSSVFRFFTPDSDCQSQRLLDPHLTDCPPRAFPLDDLNKLLSHSPAAQPLAHVIRHQEGGQGSNAWVVAASKTQQRHALLANDMHLGLNVPNIWYRAELRYGDTHLAGFTLPGLPLLIGGTNDKIAWGFTNIDGVDVADLVLLDSDPADSQVYATPDGPQRLSERLETLHVRGGADESLRVNTSIWGPVLPESLLGHRVAVQWTALDPTATNLNLLDLDKVARVDEALDVFNQIGTPPMNALVADQVGNIGWTYTGRIPVRDGFDGLAARSWADGSRRWQRYIAPKELPRRLNPASGFLVNANNKMVDANYPYLIGHGYETGSRAWRISERLRVMEQITEADMLNLQLDTQAEFYRYYQRLAVQVLDAKNSQSAVRRYLQDWDGRAETTSQGLALLVEFHRILAETLLPPFFTASRAVDSQFEYGWAVQDVPLRQLLDARLPALLPKGQTDWDGYILTLLEKSADNLLQRHGVASLQDLPWGKVNRLEMSHPLGEGLPLLGASLNMPVQPVAGCGQCVRWATRHGGAAERLAVSPGHAGQGILHMPGGQSGHPLSPFYRDQQPLWVEGRPSALLVGEIQHHLLLEPAQP